jgi:hypothetical protein
VHDEKAADSFLLDDPGCGGHPSERMLRTVTVTVTVTVTATGSGPGTGQHDVCGTSEHDGSAGVGAGADR